MTINENELLLIFAAAALSPGVSMIALESDRIAALLNRMGEVALWSADISVDGDLLQIAAKEPHNSSIYCNADPYLALIALVIGQRTKSPLSLKNTGDLAGAFPGLLADLARLGFGFAIQQTYNEDGH